MLTIGQLADYVGVSVRTIRHYHQIGLLPEPERDASGYRRYGSDDAVRLVRIRGLAAAGVPLQRVGELLAAEPEEFAAAIAEVDSALVARIAELEDHRRRLAGTTDPDAGSLGPNALRLLERMAEVGLSERSLTVEREVAILMAVAYPQKVEEWMAQQLKAFDDPEVVELYRLSDEAIDWSPDDARIEDLARRSVEMTLAHFPLDAEVEEDWWTSIDTMAYRLIDQHGTLASPGWRRATERVAELMAEAGYPVP
ncbi:MerR family transcriptional regulator [Mariniluteicoccus flavus]